MREKEAETDREAQQGGEEMDGIAGEKVKDGGELRNTPRQTDEGGKGTEDERVM